MAPVNASTCQRLDGATLPTRCSSQSFYLPGTGWSNPSHQMLQSMLLPARDWMEQPFPPDAPVNASTCQRLDGATLPTRCSSQCFYLPGTGWSNPSHQMLQSMLLPARDWMEQPFPPDAPVNVSTCQGLDGATLPTRCSSQCFYLPGTGWSNPSHQMLQSMFLPARDWMEQPFPPDAPVNASTCQRLDGATLPTRCSSQCFYLPGTGWSNPSHQMLQSMFLPARDWMEQPFPPDAPVNASTCQRLDGATLPTRCSSQCFYLPGTGWSNPSHQMLQSMFLPARDWMEQPFPPDAPVNASTCQGLDGATLPTRCSSQCFYLPETRWSNPSHQMLQSMFLPARDWMEQPFPPGAPNAFPGWQFIRAISLSV